MKVQNEVSEVKAREVLIVYDKREILFSYFAQGRAFSIKYYLFLIK